MAIENTTPKRFTATNDVTGALIKSKCDNHEVYALNWEVIFGKKQKENNADEQRGEQPTEDQ